MQSKSFLIFSLLLSVAICLECSDKYIVNNSTRHLVNANNADVTLAYNDVASCISLTTAENQVCCYIKIKFENELYDEKFTHKGCISIETRRLLEDAVPDIDDLIELYEECSDYKITPNSEDEIIYKNVEIDCSSRFIQIAGFALLLFLL